MAAYLTSEALFQKSSQELTALLYESCCSRLEDAILAIDEKDYIRANDCLQKASDIVHRLGVGLNYEAGIVAEQLEDLYNYIADQLIRANLTKDKTIIEDILNILNSIMTAWNKALNEKKSAPAG